MFGLFCSVLKYKRDFLEIVSEMMKFWQFKHLALKASKQVSLVWSLSSLWSVTSRHNFLLEFSKSFSSYLFFLSFQLCFLVSSNFVFLPIFLKLCFPYYLPHTLFFISFSSNFVAILCIYPLEKSKHTGHRRLSVRINTTHWILVPRCKSWVSQQQIVVDYQPSSAYPTPAADM